MAVRQTTQDTRFTDFLRLLVDKEDNVALKFFLKNQDKFLTEEACGPMSKLFKKRLADRAEEDKAYAKIVVEAEERRKRLEEDYAKKMEEFEARRRRNDTTGIEQLDMRPASPATRRLIYTGVSAEGNGRAKYLKVRNRQGPDEKFGMKLSSAWNVGWRLSDNIKLDDIKKSQFARTSVMQNTVYGVNGIPFSPIEEDKRVWYN
ncbi:unnamed protein product [Dibothriocephalus latus]|uniref:Sperm microtubule inner protein 1 C-terminal domain-containing protein n=1 Tax=Dibothriocephalus latus TaxID=60516 RepID=A0A3P7LBJ2_DIBLA|nr:unnamed protein product [Dibothriocephalus latus]